MSGIEITVTGECLCCLSEDRSTAYGVHEILRRDHSLINRCSPPGKTGLDQCILVSGATIIHSKTSASFRDTKGILFWAGLPLLHSMKSPEVILEVGTPRNREQPSWEGRTKPTVESVPFPHEQRALFFLQPENHPGNCWSFPGSQGHVFIKLPKAVFPRAVTLEHISARVSPGENISSAPKDFAVYVSASSRVGGVVKSISKHGRVAAGR